MIEIPPEYVAVLYGFESILSGLLVFVLLWAFFRHPTLRRNSNLTLLAGSLGGFALGFFLWSVLSFYVFYYQARLFQRLPENLGFVFFLPSALLLGAALCRPVSRKGRLALILIVAGLVTVALAASFGLGAPLGSWQWLSLGIVFGTFGLLVKSGKHRLRPVLVRLVFWGFSASFVFRFLTADYSGAVSETALWLAQHTAVLGALVALAHIIEIETDDLFIKFFIRLNLTFVMLAGLLIVTVTRLQRNEYIDFAVRETADLVEFIRGHVLFFHLQGGDSASVAGNTEIIREIVTAFDRVPELKAATIRFRNEELQLKIQPNGLIETRGAKGPFLNNPYSPEPALVGQVLRLSSPIVLDDSVQGWVVLDKGVTTMNRQVGTHILIVFSTFSFMVVVGGVLIGIIVAQADHTIGRQHQELVASHNQLLQAAKLAAVGEMAEGVAHEINNPLSVIVGRADYLVAVARMKKADEFREDLEVIQRNAGRTARIVKGLLDFGRSHALDRRQCDVNRLLDETCELMRARLHQKKIKLKKALGSVPLISVDRNRMQQVLVNLLNNAVDACYEHGTVTVESYVDPESVLKIVIGDKGVGIPDENLGRVFDPFFTTKKGGTGLGLSVSYGIVRDHDGKLTVTSDPSRGTRFAISLRCEVGGEP